MAGAKRPKPPEGMVEAIQEIMPAIQNDPKMLERLQRKVLDKYDFSDEESLDPMQAPNLALKALDYPAGLTRTAVMDLFLPEKAVGKSDYERALRGSAPSSGEMLGRPEAGVPAGASLSEILPPGMSPYSDTEGEWLSKGGPLDPMARGAGAFVADVLLDPLAIGSMVTKPASAARIGVDAAIAAREAEKAAQVAKLAPAPGPMADFAGRVGRGVKNLTRAAVEGILHPVSQPMGWAGQKVFRGPFKKLDAEAKRMGKIPLSDVAWDEAGFAPSKAGLFDELQGDVVPRLAGEREALYKQIDEAGETVDVAPIVGSAEDTAKTMRTSGDVSPQTASLAPGMQSMAEGYKEQVLKRAGVTPRPAVVDETGKMVKPAETLDEAYQRALAEGGGQLPVDIASEWKSDISSALPESSWDQLKRTKQGQRASKKMGSDFRKAILDAANRVDPNLGDEIVRLNEPLGSIAETKKKLYQEAVSEGGRPMVGTGDLFHFKMGQMGGSPNGGLTTLMVKKILDMIRYNRARMGAGRIMDTASKTRIADPLAREFLLQYGGQRPSPWSLLQEEEK